MEKVSSILAGSPRVKAVDLGEDHPVRPGAPTFGRKEGTTSAQRDRISLSAAGKEAAFAETLASHDPRKEETSQIRTKNTDQFFQSKMNSMNKVPEATDPEGRMVQSIAHEFADTSPSARQRANEFAEARAAASEPMFPAVGAPKISGGTLNKYA